MMNHGAMGEVFTTHARLTASQDDDRTIAPDRDEMAPRANAKDNNGLTHNDAKPRCVEQIDQR